MSGASSSRTPLHFQPVGGRIPIHRPEKMKTPACAEVFRDPAGARTQDPYIKSVMLYQLSYRIKKQIGDEQN